MFALQHEFNPKLRSRHARVLVPRLQDQFEREGVLQSFTPPGRGCGSRGPGAGQWGSKRTWPAGWSTPNNPPASRAAAGRHVNSVQYSATAAASGGIGRATPTSRMTKILRPMITLPQDKNCFRLWSSRCHSFAVAEIVIFVNQKMLLVVATLRNQNDTLGIVMLSVFSLNRMRNRTPATTNTMIIKPRLSVSRIPHLQDVVF